MSDRKIITHKSNSYTDMDFHALLEIMNDFKNKHPDAIDGEYHLTATEYYVGDGHYCGAFYFECDKYESEQDEKKRLAEELKQKEDLEKKEYENYLRLKEKFEGKK